MKMKLYGFKKVISYNIQMKVKDENKCNDEKNAKNANAKN